VFGKKGLTVESEIAAIFGRLQSKKFESFDKKVDKLDSRFQGWELGFDGHAGVAWRYGA
jgi:hypothetical protein